VNKDRSAALLMPISGREFRVGDYLHSGTDLFRIEEIVGDRFVLEDCRTEELIETEYRQLLTLEPVRRTQREVAEADAAETG
jgi:hypothetical protein